jgi:ABC-type polysaccharide/polyol phosphate transport system ATPase subunit
VFSLPNEPGDNAHERTCRFITGATGQDGDEGIGAGDARFAESAQRRLSEFVGRSRIIVIASHSHDLIKSICNKPPLLQAGRLVSIGSVEEVFEQYAASSRTLGRVTG